MGKLTGGYDRSFPYLWVVRLGGTITTADALASLGSVHGKNTGEMVRGWDCEEPSDDITFGMGDDLEFLRSLEPVGG